MVWEILYSKNPEEALSEIEGRRLDDELDRLSDEFFPESESVYNRKRRGLKIVGGKFYERDNV